jgi:Fe-coproporphyrin III synthase
MDKVLSDYIILQNILDYIAGPNRHNKPARKDIWISMTINSMNHDTIEDLTHEWIGKVNKIGFQFHTPFVKDDPLWMPFGDKRNNVVERLITLKNKYPNFVVNGIKQLSLMKGNWGGIGTTPVQCLLGYTFIRSPGKSEAMLYR